MLSTEAALDDYSFEITARDLPALASTADRFPAGTRVNVTYLGTEDAADRLAAARAVADHGLTPVPHISARRLLSEADLTSFLDGLAAQGTHRRVFAVGGDPAQPHGPYSEAAQVIASGHLAAAGVREVGIGGYPEGHPDIDDAALWDALTLKTRLIAEQGMNAAIATQFSFDTDAVLTWIRRVRDAGVDAPIRVGVPGPAGVKRLLGFARRCGVASSATLARKYGFSLGNLLGTAGPDAFIEDLAAGIDHGVHGEVRLHFFTFGGLDATASWLERRPVAA
ncbi:methylenetetrahydrofolate reductase [Demequina sp. NBRC 110057]|uniref:methylenetetrahydrofolate reductase n=1 Tax=Demequina sp. NBRC 110057 TaxID=1570346 RepID=UPI000A06F0AD|nr:methylenetetrahydrofolate reductase [Demequina sp. NBRC 110057]